MSLAPPPYRILGSGSLLIYVAGLDGTGELFFRQIPDLVQKYRVVTFRSRESGRFDYDDLSDDIAAIIADNGESRAMIVGESFGGTVALNFALRHPSMIDRLVIVNSFPRFRGRLRIRLATMISSGVSFRLVTPFRILSSALGLYIDGVTRDDRRRFFNAISTVKEEGYVQRLRLIEALDIDHRLREITVPVLFVAATNDIVVPSVREARFMNQEIPGSVINVIAGAGHACLMGSKVRLAQLIERWSEATETVDRHAV